MDNLSITLCRTSNQALELGIFAREFLSGKYASPSESVFQRLKLFHLDSVCCAVSALALGTNAPNILRNEALRYTVTSSEAGAKCFGSHLSVTPEKAVLANCAAVREWDANGTNFGFNPEQKAMAGEFGHNDFYPVALAAAQVKGLDGHQLLLGMLLIDEIRGRLAEVFSLKDYKIDHVVHGGIASAVVYGAMIGATPKQIESAVGLLVAHYIPFRAIRSGKQLSDSKGASAAMSAEMAVLSVQRAMSGFVGPGDVFRNSQAIFCLNQPPASTEESPFDLTLTTGGDNFALLGMHFKLGLYEHQSAGGIQALINLLRDHPQLLTSGRFPERIQTVIYEPAYGIICDPSKKNPQTRQTADHSLPFILAAVLVKAYKSQSASWKELMLLPEDYTEEKIHDPTIRQVIATIDVIHGGDQYDHRYPQGIPTAVILEHADIGRIESKLVMYPLGHAKSDHEETRHILDHKISTLAKLGVKDPNEFVNKIKTLEDLSPSDVLSLYECDIDWCDKASRDF